MKDKDISLACFGCQKKLGNGDKVRFIKFAATTQMFCYLCEEKILQFIAALHQKKGNISL